MRKVGLILDVAERAATLGDDFAAWADLPASGSHRRVSELDQGNL
jgi:hypothetical protein